MGLRMLFGVFNVPDEGVFLLALIVYVRFPAAQSSPRTITPKTLNQRNYLSKE